MGPRYDEILTDEAQAFLAELHRNFEPRRRELLLRARGETEAAMTRARCRISCLRRRSVRDTRVEGRADPGRPAEPPRRDHRPGRPQDDRQCAQFRRHASTWRISRTPIRRPGRTTSRARSISRTTGPARSTSPIRATRSDTRSATNPAVLIVRPRGWHLDEVHVEIDGEPISASLFDFGLYFFHNALKTTTAGSGPYFYLPKLESHKEARLWNDVFLFAQKHISVWPRHHQGDGADRDACPPRSRWTKSCARCATTSPA